MTALPPYYDPDYLLMESQRTIHRPDGKLGTISGAINGTRSQVTLALPGHDPIGLSIFEAQNLRAILKDILDMDA